MANNTRKRLAGLAVSLCLLALARPAAAQNGIKIAPKPTVARVRSESPLIRHLITEATRRSATFRRLVAAIDASDGLVYVQPGACRHGVRACLILGLTAAGPSRMLRIVVDAQKEDWDLIGSIAHELQHAIEVLGDPSVRSTANVLSKRWGTSSGDRFETESAIEAGFRVRDEVRKSNKPTRAPEAEWAVADDAPEGIVSRDWAR